MADTKNVLDPETAAEHKAMFDFDITLIQQSPYGSTPHGKEIVALLTAFNKEQRIRYEPLEERGAWDGTDILVSDNYIGKVFPTTCELAHEGAHALWRKKNPTKKMTQLEVDAEEKAAQTVQAKVYLWLRAKKGAPVDSDIEGRLAGLGLSSPEAGKKKR
ncbi:hypothetical protein [Viridibacterium curvum]|uniref:Uncharacterized protein n=1 Tax=Viridibacterium curvum TaxID=1101404 RepID=A0ABP9QHB0_9RHOO